MKDRRKSIVAAAYDRMSRRYLDWAAGIQDDARDRMLGRFVERLPDSARLLDLGCGAGVPSTRQLARRFDVVGVDISKSQVELARRNVPNATFFQADIAELSFPDESFDGVLALYAISHVPRDEHQRIFANVFRWLVPGGLFLATLGAGDSPDWTGTWLGEEMFFSSHDAAMNRRLLRAAGFELVVNEIVVTREPEGDVPFLWVIGQKTGLEDRDR